MTVFTPYAKHLRWLLVVGVLLVSTPGCHHWGCHHFDHHHHGRDHGRGRR